MDKNQKTVLVRKNGGNFFKADIVRKYFNATMCVGNPKVIYVFSAMAGMTRLLEDIFQKTKSCGNALEVNSLLNKFEDDHVYFIYELFKGIDKNIPYVDKLFDELIRVVLRKHDFINEDHRRASILQFGELVSCGIISAYLDSLDIKHKLLDARDHIVTTDNHRDAEIIEVKGLNEFIANQEHEALIIPGFMGRNLRGEVTSLPFNGSDSTAAEVAIAAHNLGYHVPQVVFGKDVDGVYDADPKLFENAKIQSEITPEQYETILSTNKDSYPVFPVAVARLAKVGIPVRVQSYLNLSHPGTLIKSSSC